MSAHQANFSKLRPESVPGYIYLVQVVGTDKFKIGRAIDVPKRLCGLQTGNPLRIRYVYHVYVDNMNLSEMELHQKFSQQREIGEWFVFNRKDVERCILLMRLLQQIEPSEDAFMQGEPEKLNLSTSIKFRSEPEELTTRNKFLIAEILKAREEGKTNTWVIENVLNMKGRKFGQGKVWLQDLLDEFGSKKEESDS